MIKVIVNTSNKGFIVLINDMAFYRWVKAEDYAVIKFVNLAGSNQPIKFVRSLGVLNNVVEETEHLVSEYENEILKSEVLKGVA